MRAISRASESRVNRLTPGGAGGDFDEPLPRIGFVAFVDGAVDILPGGSDKVALILTDSAGFECKKIRLVQPAAALGDAGKRFIVQR